MSELTWLVRPPDPLSGAAKEILQAPEDRLDNLGGFIRTSRARRIGYELGRYCLREQEGCSLLIAGGRGAGKTTLIRLVVQELIINWRRGEILRNARSANPEILPLVPLPIILHGPTLLDIYERPDALAKPPPDLLPELSGKFEDSRRRAALKERALRMMITALYTHFRDALIDAWDNAVRVRHGGLTPDMAELRAHLDLLLDTAPDVKPLRRIWKRAGFMDAGVLPNLYPLVKRPAPPAGQEQPAPPRQPPPVPKPHPDQAIRELHALKSCAQSFLSILGQIKETQTKGGKDTDEATAAIGVATPRPEAEKKPTEPAAANRPLTIVVPAIVGTAAAVAHGVLTPAAGAVAHLGSSAATGLGALVLAHISLFLSKLTLRADRTYRRSSYEDRALTVDVDWSAQRLERELPNLLSLVKDAGLAPIFVIDELDKLEEPFDELHDFLHMTKHIVRDQAAFLFLSNRNYFERVMQTRADLSFGNDSEQPLPATTPQPEAPPPAPPASGADAQAGSPAKPSSPWGQYGSAGISAEEEAIAARLKKQRRQKAAARTFYEHMLSLFYEPADFRHYFETLYRKTLPKEANEGKPSPSPRDETVVDILAIGTLLAFRSRLYPFEFNQRLNSLLDDEGRLRKISIGEGSPFFDQMILQHLLLQVIAETIAQKANVAARIDSRPREAQMLYDALYFIADRIEFSPPAAGRRHFVTVEREQLYAYLLAKTTSDSNPELLKDAFEPAMLQWLFKQVETQITYLADPQKFLTKETAREAAAALLPMGPSAGGSSSGGDAARWYADPEMVGQMQQQIVSHAKAMVGSITRDGEAITFELLVDGYANRRDDETAAYSEIGVPRDQLATLVADAQVWKDALEALLGTATEAHALASSLGILPENTRWEPVQNALDRAENLLADSAGTESSTVGGDTARDLIRDLGAYLQAIRGYRHLFDRCMRAASVVALATKGKSIIARRRAALRLMDTMLPPKRDRESTDTAMRIIRRERLEWAATPFGPLLQRPKNLDMAPMKPWFRFLHDIAAKTDELADQLDSDKVWKDLDSRYWMQWSWSSPAQRVVRRKGISLFDLVFAARHGGFRYLEAETLQPKLGLWSLLLFHSMQEAARVPAPVEERVRRDLGLDLDPEEPALLVVSKTAAPLAWRPAGKIPAIALSFDPNAAKPAIPLGPTEAADLIGRAFTVSTGRDERQRPAGRRPWMLAVDTADEMPIETGLLFSILGSPVSYVLFGPGRANQPDDRPHLVDPKSLEALYRFALDNRRPDETA